MRFQAVLWDLDGTLIDSVGDIAAGVNHARKVLHHPPFPVDSVRGFVGDGVYKLIERSFPANEGTRAMELFREYYGANLIDQTVPYPGILETLKAFQAAAIQQGVVTNKPTTWAEQILSGLHLTPYFGAILGGDHPAGRKPSPEPLRVALTTLKRMDLQSAAMIGDGRNDVLSAQALGIAVCGVTFGIGDPSEIRELKPDILADSPQAIQDWILRS